MKRFLFAAHAVFWATLALASDDWPQFRGPAGNGLSDSQGLSATWSETNNVRWKSAVHGRGWSSPVVWGNQLWVTTATEDGRELFAVCLDRESGKIMHDLKLFEVAAPQFAHKFNSYASPTPVIEEGRVYVTFGSPGTACVDTKTGKMLWERRDLVCNHYRGAGSSPILSGDLLIMNFDGSDYQYVVALDKKTGKTAWKVDRGIDFKDLGPDGKPQAEGDFRKAFSTPHVAELGGKPLLISQGAKAHYGYDPRTGTELWRVEERSCHSAATRPVVGEGLIFLPTGFSRAQLLAVRVDMQQQKHLVIDAAKAAASPDSGQDRPPMEIVWKTGRNVPNKPSVLLVNKLLFMIDDGGIASCLESQTGTEVWRERVGGNYSASPVYGNDQIYFCSEEGKTTVIKAGRQFRPLATNQLGDGFMASPAISGKALFLRSKTHIYRVSD